MNKILKGELYKLKNNSTYKKIAIGVIITLVAYIMYLLFYEKISREELLFSVVPGKFNTIILMLVVFCYLYQEDYRNNTFKNIVYMVQRRDLIFLGKQVFQGGVVVAIYIVLLLITLLCSFFFESDGVEVREYFNFGLGYLLIILVMLRALAFLNILTVITKNDYVIFASYLFATNFFDLVISVLSESFNFINIIKEYTIQGQIRDIMLIYQSNDIITKIVLCNVIMLGIYTFIGNTIFKKSNI